MSVMRKAMVYLGLVDDEEFYADDDVYYADADDAYEEPRERERERVGARAGGRREHMSAIQPAADAGPGPVTVMRARREEPAPAPVARATSVVTPVPMPATRVHVMDPRGFNDAQEVGDRLKAGQPVILNLQGVDRDLQRRLIDFSSGLAYALNGTMSKAADQVFLLTPSNVEVSEEEKERLQARGLYRAGR
jgi:cell division inhibitor SepF